MPPPPAGTTLPLPKPRGRQSEIPGQTYHPLIPDIAEDADIGIVRSQ